MRRHNLSLEKKRSLSGYIFSLPWIIGFLVFMTYPFVTSFMLSISKIDELTGLKMHFIGGGNYVKLFTEDTKFLPALLVTIQNTVLYTPLIIVISLCISLLISRNLAGKGIFRVIFFLPVLLGSGYAMQQLGDAGNILQLPSGLEDYLKYYFNTDVAETLENILLESLSMFWKSGVQIIIFIGGIQAIPDSYYEAALVDNANSWDVLWKITLPMLSPMIFLNVIYTIIDSFRDSSNPITELVINQIFDNSKYEYGSAMGWVYFVVAFAVVGITTVIFRRHTYYEQ